MDIEDIAFAISESNRYSDGLALNGVPIKQPQIDAVTKHWRIFDPVLNAYIDTGVSAEGASGKTSQFRVNGGTLQHKYATDPPSGWADLYEFPDASVYTHTQGTPSTTWVMPHNLNEQYPDITIIDSAGDINYPDFNYTSANTTTAIFTSPTAGIAKIRR